ncbi:hypothetical protein GGP41_009151 [Bipolaris sorokiniana]|uniref:Uncharacterized protein n=1 Tax=Cochliobolus sativus TaxID=45130 RepID=A0A8H5ZCQ4_COCSA|nr:hypothetical protein GGP41_009151 [Bipolaris sorokiniana]
MANPILKQFGALSSKTWMSVESTGDEFRAWLTWCLKIRGDYSSDPATVDGYEEILRSLNALRRRLRPGQCFPNQQRPSRTIQTDDRARQPEFLQNHELLSYNCYLSI